MKKLFAIIICCSIIVLSFLLPVDAEGKTVLYLDYGDIAIGDGELVGYDSKGNGIFEPNENGYIITQLNSTKELDYGVSVVSGTHDIEIENLNIQRTDAMESAFSVSKNTVVNITLTGTNYLYSGTYRGGLELSVSATVSIGGDGTLYAKSEMQAGIGGGNGRSNGNLTINSGTINAVGGVGGYSAGIGGGTYGSGGTITINGGNVTATGGMFGSGIGGGNGCTGGTITINGGSVTAVAGAGGAGIGGGYTANGGTIVINGGSVKATAGQGAATIGNGYKCTTDFAGIKNTSGDSLVLVTFDATDYSDIYCNGIDNPVEKHSEDESLYFYPSDDTIITAIKNDGTVKYFKGGSLAEKTVFENAERISDWLLVESKDNITLATNFSIENNELIYNGKAIDQYTPVIRGDGNLDDTLDGTDAVIANCVKAGMLKQTKLIKLSDVNGDNIVDENDVDTLTAKGLFN